MLLYRGPIVTAAQRNQQDLHSEIIINDLALSSDGSGTIATVTGSYATAPAAWTNLIAIYDEYRTLGFSVKYTPNDRYNRGTTVYTTPIYTVSDYDTSTALTSYANAAQYASCKQRSLDTPWSHTIRMNGVENSQFLNTASPANTMFIKFFATGLSLSTAYGRLTTYIRIQFRGKGV